MPELLAEGGLLDTLGINLKVLGFQAAVLLVLFFILNRLVFGRLHSFMTAREEESRASLEKIERGKADVERLAREYEGRLAAVEKEAYARLQEILKQGIEAKNHMLAESQSRARAEVERARREIADEKRQAAEQLRAEVVGLTLEAVGRVLDRPLDEATHGAAVRKILSEVGR